MTQSSSLILTTKLVIPAIQGDIVKRPRLLDKLRLAHPLPVNIISAPAGFGKTTLMANWISNINKPVAWYSLDEADNDPVRFITHFIAAMQTIIPAFGDAELELLTHSQSIPILSLMPGLINAINQHYQTIIFIFDDFQFISNSTVLNAVVSLIDHQPVNLILGITSRVDPSLPLPRLRVRRQLNEITDQDLRFTVEEARDYLQILMGLNLSNENIQTLEQKTEGWIAGLQLAGLSLQGNKQPDEFIASFSGDDRYVMDYLTEEVLSRQPEQTKNFLLETSVLERLSGPLCRAVTGITDSVQILEQLERSNMFVVPLDNHRTWFRYHHLFAELLQRRLSVEQPAKIPDLHKRAGQWYAAQGLYNEAMQHAFAAQDVALQTEILDRFGMEMFVHAANQTLLKWFERMPEDVFHSHPRRALLRAWVLFTNTAEPVPPWLQSAESVLDMDTDFSVAPEIEHKNLRAEIALIRAFIALHQRDLKQAKILSQSAINMLPDNNIMMKAASYLNLAIAYNSSGQLTMAEENFRSAISLTMTVKGVIVYCPAIAGLAELQIMQGKLKEAVVTLDQGRHYLAEHGWQHLPDSNLFLANYAYLLGEFNQLDASNEVLEKAIKTLEYIEWSHMNLLLHYDLAINKVRQGKIEEAERILQPLARCEFDQSLFPTSPTPDYFQKIYWWLLGKYDLLTQWAEKFSLHKKEDIWPADIDLILRYVRVLLFQRQYDQAMQVLSQLLLSAEADQRTGHIIEILTLQSLVRQGQGDTKRALTILQNALQLAQPQGYIRLFVDEGPAMAALLNLLANHPQVGAYARQLLEVYGDFVKTESAVETTPAGLLEPLSEKELETLRYMMSGLNNKEIGDKMFVSNNTIKTHIKHIYQKLQVNSRTQAVLRARELNLLQ